MKNPIKTLFAKALNQMVFGQNGWQSLFALPRTRVDYEAEVGSGLTASVVMAPVGWIQRTFPEAPVIVQQRNSDHQWETVADHPMIDLLDQPNPYYSGVQLWSPTILSWCLDGNAYWVKVRSMAGRVVQLWYVPHWMIKPACPNDGSEFISHYDYRPVNTTIRLEVDDVVHLRYGLDPNNIRLGLSPLKSVLREVFTDLEADNFTASLMRNSGVPGLVIAPKESGAMVSGAELKTMKAYVHQQFTGDHRGEPFLASGPTEVHQFGFNPRQLNLRDIRALPEERVTAVFGIPAIIAGLGAGLARSTFSNYAEAREAAYESNIIPTQRLMSSELRSQLLVDYHDTRGYRVGFDNSEVRILQEDENARTERWNGMLASGGVTLAEYRAAQGLDVSSADDVYLRQSGVVVVTRDQAALLPVAPKSKALERGDSAKGATQDDIIAAFNRDAVMLERAFADDLVAAFQQMGDDMAAIFAAMTLPPLPQTSSNGGGAELKQDEADRIVVEGLVRLFDFTAWDQASFSPAYSTHYLRTLETTYRSIDAVLHLAADIPDPVARSIVATGGTRKGLVDVVGEARTALYRALHDGRSLGEGADALARRIREQVPAGRFSNAGPKYRARMIARTETKYAQNVSALATYRTTDVVTGLLCFDAQAGATDADCEERDGRIFTFAEAEALTANEHPNGTLSFAPVTN